MTVTMHNATNSRQVFALTHTMVAGGPFFGSTGYNQVAGPFGSLSPDTYLGVDIFAIQHSTSGPQFSILISGVRAQDFWTECRFQSVDLNYDGVLFRSPDATFTLPGGDSQWVFPFTPAFINGTTYLVDLT